MRRFPRFIISSSNISAIPKVGSPLVNNAGDVYASPYGASIPMDFSRCIVAIRGVSWSMDIITCVVGCGIVGQSILEREIEEIKHKLYCTLENLGIFREQSD